MKTALLLQIPLQTIGIWLAATYAPDSIHIGWLRLVPWELIAVLIAGLITIAVVRPTAKTRSLPGWIVLPAHALIGSRLGFLICASLFSQPAIGMFLGASGGIVIGICASRALGLPRPHQQHAT